MNTGSEPIPGLGHAAASTAALVGSPGLTDTQNERIKLLAHLARSRHPVS